jgi:hypothetical protein
MAALTLRSVLAFLLVAHLVYLWLLPSLGGRALSALGFLILLTVSLAARASRRFAGRVASELPAMGTRTAALLAALALLPLFSFFGDARIAFWRVDGRALVIIAWLVGVSALALTRPVRRSSPVRGRFPVLTQLFVLWSALFWLMVVWDVGVGHAVAHVTAEDWLTTAFGVWETRPARDHLFLMWQSREAFDQGVAYTNHLHPFTFALYAWTKLVQWGGGLPMVVGRNLTPFAMAGLGVVALVGLIPRWPGVARGGWTFHATLFLALGFLLTQWYLWVYPFTWGFITVFPIIAFLTTLVWSSARPRVTDRNASWLLGCSVIFAAFAWLYTPLVILALWCFFGRSRPSLADTVRFNRPLVRASIAALAVGAAAYSLPLLLAWTRGYEVSSSSFLFRSGLDGDTRYFQTALQAVTDPHRPARIPGSLWPAFVPFLLAGAWAWRSAAGARRQFVRVSLFLLAPYVFSVALFPQSVSIHPNLYDPLLLLPVVLIGSAWMLRPSMQRRLSGPGALAGLLLATLLIMGNLVAIAQGMAQRLVT